MQLTITPDPPLRDTRSNGHRPAPVAPAEDQVLTALFAALPQPICVHDLGHRILLANTAAASLVGYRVDELTRLNFECLLLPCDTPRWRRFLRAVHHTGTAHASYFRLHHHGGTWLWVHATATAFTTGDVRLVAVAWEDRTGEISEDPRTICTEL